jgi:hypothetical protein
MFPQLVRGSGLVLGLATLAALVAPAVAQEQIGLAFPVTPEPAECRVAARPVDDLITILTAGGEASTVAETPAETTIPLGYPAGAERAAEVSATVREAVACINAGDFLRTTALLTDDGVRRFFGPWAAEEPWTEADVRQAFAATAPLPAEERQTILGIANVSRLTDGRLTAIALIADPYAAGGQPQALFVYFAYEDGRWLIDEFAELSRF